MKKNRIKMTKDFAYKHNKQLSCINEESLLKALDDERIKEMLKTNSFYLVNLSDYRYKDKMNFDILPDTSLGKIKSIDIKNLTAEIEVDERYVDVIEKLDLKFHMLGEMTDTREYIVKKILRIGFFIS